ncbi:molybdopterin molybdotransferase MoeA [Alkalibacillus aidingensis]|uniref:molybdopterin molybdotransferase MoeA n=1 Tax=Alkalibacillus aidingensis TaxID=2747607 RepID=UPI001660B0B9|nr:gephyrin-like molybdotransferase Glp [Alkalibacillus aidingensis]
MVERRKPILVSEAIEKCIKEVQLTHATKVPLDESLNYFLSEDIMAPSAVPHFDRSPFDGFAIRSTDTENASGDNRIEFRVVDHIGAGQVSDVKLGENEAVRIMTGAALPELADCVVMLEQTVEYEGSFTIRKPFEKGENVSFKGEDIQKGEQILSQGTKITPGVIAVLATFGFAEVPVRRKPLVGILSTGTELLEVSEPLEHGKIRNSNGPMVAGQLKRLNIPYRFYQISKDDLDTTIESVKQALNEVDCLITTGGVSVGDFDYLPKVYEALGATVLFNKVGMRPGSVTTVAKYNEQYLFGLSGNPSACYTGIELFARPVLLKMLGSNHPFLPGGDGVLQESFEKPNPFTRFIRAFYEEKDGEVYVTPAGFNKSNAISSIARSNALIVLPRGTRGYQQGDAVKVLYTDRDEGALTWAIPE